MWRSSLSGSGVGLVESDGKIHPWVLTCLRCNVRTPDEDHAFGIDTAGQPFPVKSI